MPDLLGFPFEEYDGPFFRDWDGTFTATCPCGRDATWNAYINTPLCVCALIGAHREQQTS